MDKKFEKKKYDEQRWDRAKNVVRKIKKDQVETDWDDKDWRLANSLFHKMRKNSKE